MLAHFSFVHTASLSSAPPSVPSSPSSQSVAPTVAEGESTVPEDGEGEKCAFVGREGLTVRACMHCNASVHACIT